MRPLLFFSITILLYLSCPYFIYRYHSLQSWKGDEIKIESGIVNTTMASDTDQQSEKEEIEQQGKNIILQSYGYAGGAVFTILCPTLMLIFRHRFLR